MSIFKFVPREGHQLQEHTLQEIISRLIERGLPIAQPTKERLEDPYDLRTHSNYFEIYDREISNTQIGYLFESPLGGVIGISIHPNSRTNKPYRVKELGDMFKSIGLTVKRTGYSPLRNNVNIPEMPIANYFHFEGDTLVMEKRRGKLFN